MNKRILAFIICGIIILSGAAYNETVRSEEYKDPVNQILEKEVEVVVKRKPSTGVITKKVNKPSTGRIYKSGKITPKAEEEPIEEEIEVAEEVIEEPEEVVEEEPSTEYIGTFIATAYCNCSICCGSWSGCNTASGTVPTQGRTVACNILPLGTRILIDGAEYVVEDTGYSPFGDYWLDIYFENHDDCINFGMREVEVSVIYE